MSIRKVKINLNFSNENENVQIILIPEFLGGIDTWSLRMINHNLFCFTEADNYNHHLFSL